MDGLQPPREHSRATLAVGSHELAAADSASYPGLPVGSASVEESRVTHQVSLSGSTRGRCLRHPRLGGPTPERVRCLQGTPTADLGGGVTHVPPELLEGHPVC